MYCIPLDEVHVLVYQSPGTIYWNYVDCRNYVLSVMTQGQGMRNSSLLHVFVEGKRARFNPMCSLVCLLGCQFNRCGNRCGNGLSLCMMCMRSWITASPAAKFSQCTWSSCGSIISHVGSILYAGISVFVICRISAVPEQGGLGYALAHVLEKQ